MKFINFLVEKSVYYLFYFLKVKIVLPIYIVNHLYNKLNSYVLQKRLQQPTLNFIIITSKMVICVVSQTVQRELDLAN